MKYKLRKIQLLEAKINNFLENVLIEKVDNDILRDMSSFGLSKNDIDNEGYVTLYHGGVNLPNKLKKDDIFFMTPSQHEAQDYANMRNGSVYTKNDKAFASSGTITNKFMSCSELIKPRVKRDQIKEIILGGGQNLLSPERRFDAIIHNSPDIF